MFPFYLSIGMTYEQFWDMDCTLVKAYREAHKIRLKEADYNAWLQGYYTFNALCCVAPIMHAFADKGTKVIPYPNKPYSVAEKPKEQLNKNDAKAKTMMEIFMVANNKKFEEVKRDAG